MSYKENSLISGTFTYFSVLLFKVFCTLQYPLLPHSELEPADADVAELRVRERAPDRHLDHGVLRPLLHPPPRQGAHTHRGGKSGSKHGATNSLDKLGFPNSCDKYETPIYVVSAHIRTEMRFILCKTC